MAKLYISGFSCLHEAEFEIKPVVAIIGPQGSGKSVTTKLNYYFSEILESHIAAAERGDSLEEFKRTLGKKFRTWFPPSAWGHARFNLQYTSGDFWVRILRRVRAGKPSEDLAINFPDWFDDFYRKSQRSFENIRERSLDEELDKDESFSDPLEASLRMRDMLRVRISRQLREEYIHSQTFIPAGRAFFTSIGKMVAGFDSAGNLDPITVRFAKRFADLRDRSASLAFRSRLRRLSQEFKDRSEQYSTTFFGGNLVYESDLEYVQAEDGRKIPFSALSSGQQEILPMWTLVQYLGELEDFRREHKTTRREILYIEEPEAHLFPRAQSGFLGYLFDTLSFRRGGKSLILTTHSPYIMSRLNVFLKAGALSRRKKNNTALNEIVPRERWLLPQDFSAYAIDQGRIRNIVGSDGIIDSSFLDSISEDILHDFDRLLELEASFA